MAKSKQTKDIKGYLFIAAGSGSVNVVYDDNDDDAGLSAAIASAMLEDNNLFNIISTALLAIVDDNEKYNSKKSNKLPKTVKKTSK